MFSSTTFLPLLSSELGTGMNDSGVVVRDPLGDVGGTSHPEGRVRGRRERLETVGTLAAWSAGVTILVKGLSVGTGAGA